MVGPLNNNGRKISAQKCSAHPILSKIFERIIHSGMSPFVRPACTLHGMHSGHIGTCKLEENNIVCDKYCGWDGCIISVEPLKSL